MMFPQLGVTELVFTLTQQMIKHDTYDLKTPCSFTAYIMAYVTISIQHDCQRLRTLRARITKRGQYVKCILLQVMFVQKALPTILRWV